MEVTVDEVTTAFVQRRANGRCEYCHLPQAYTALLFEVEHIIAKQHDGQSVMSNLAYACLHCNRHKGPNLSGLDRIGSHRRIVKLFHPRLHRWDYHFAWDGPRLIGKTPIGRVTVRVLYINDPLMVLVREELIAEGLFP